MPVFGVRVRSGWSAGGAPALFGPLVDAGGVCAPFTVVEPADACTPLRSSVEGKVVLVERGGCFFVDKVGFANQAGAVGVVVVDTMHPRVHSFNAMIGVEGRPWAISIPSILIGRAAASQLSALAESRETVCLERFFPRAADKVPTMSPRDAHEFDRVQRAEVAEAFHFVTIALVNAHNEALQIQDMLLEMVAMQLEVQWRMDLVAVGE
jgi:hypothetical protein